MSNPFNAIGTYLLNEWAKIEGIFVGAVTGLLPFLKTQAAADLATILPIAQNIVATLITDPTKSGAEKRTAAFAYITSTLTASGQTVKASLVNTSIEIAYQILQTAATDVVDALTPKPVTPQAQQAH